MRVYRIAREKFIQDLSGEGARLYGGRWNPKGRAVLYTSAHQSLAALEVLVHTSFQYIPPDLNMLTLKVPDELPEKIISPKDLPGNWNEYPAPSILGEIGTKWLNENATLILKVPSVVIPEEWNVLLNPAHELFSEIKIEQVKDFTFDPRFNPAN